MKTISESYFEQWCGDLGIECRRVKEARKSGHKRPDYAIKVLGYRLIVEVKQIDQNREDVALSQQELLAGQFQMRWVSPGARLRQSIKDAANQLRKFSKRGLPTVICFFDATIGFYLEHVHVVQAMFGQESLRFDVSSDPNREAQFLGVRFGKKATMTREQNTSVSAVAVLRHPLGSRPVIELYHNPYARVQVAPELCTTFVAKQYGQYGKAIETADRRDKSVLDLMQTDEWQEWLDDPEGKCAREIEKCLRELRGQAPGN